jgi:hypothetical protein
MRVTLPRLAAAVALVAAAAPASAAPTPPAPGKAGDPMAAARKALDEVADYAYQARTLNDVIADVKERSKVAVLLDPVVYQFGLDPHQPVVNVTLKQAKLRDALKAVLAPFNLRFGVIREGLFVSTEDGVTARQLRQRVTLDCDGTPLAAATKQLAADTGANLVLDPRLAEKANRPVTLKLDDVPLETAVRLLAEVADLRAVRMSNVLFVTTPDRAEKLRPDADGPVPSSPVNPVFPFVNPPPGGPGGPVPLPPVIGLGGGVPAPAVPLPAPKVERPPDPPPAPMPVEKKN